MKSLRQFSNFMHLWIMLDTELIGKLFDVKSVFAPNR